MQRQHDIVHSAPSMIYNVY